MPCKASFRGCPFETGSADPNVCAVRTFRVERMHIAAIAAATSRLLFLLMRKEFAMVAGAAVARQTCTDEWIDGAWHMREECECARSLQTIRPPSTWTRRRRPVGAPTTHIEVWSGRFPEGPTTASISVMATTSTSGMPTITVLYRFDDNEVPIGAIRFS